MREFVSMRHTDNNIYAFFLPDNCNIQNDDCYEIWSIERTAYVIPTVFTYLPKLNEEVSLQQNFANTCLPLTYVLSPSKQQKIFNFNLKICD